MKKRRARLQRPQRGDGVRRRLALYNDSRPLSFYKVGADFPQGWLITADGKDVLTARGDPIITKEVGRERPIETEFSGDVDRAYLIKFFSLREPNVEWFRIEEVQKD